MLRLFSGLLQAIAFAMTAAILYPLAVPRTVCFDKLNRRKVKLRVNGKLRITAAVIVNREAVKQSREQPQYILDCFALRLTMTAAVILNFPLVRGCASHQRRANIGVKGIPAFAGMTASTQCCFPCNS